MSSTFKYPVRAFTILTFVGFWIFFSITGILVFSDVPQIYQTIMKNVCAWTSTFVLIIFFKKFRPNESFLSFLRQQFSSIRFIDFLIPTFIQVAIVVITTIIIFSINRVSISEIQFISVYNFFPLIIVNITSGPMGEELGWRGFALRELQKKYNLFLSSLLIGVLWGLWHFPLWFVSGYSGLDLLIYAAAFMLGIMSFSVFITYFYNKKKNILLAVWIHFLFNILMQIVILEDMEFILFVSLLYLLVSCLILILNKDKFFNNKTQET